jgi:hypothetical protein
MKITHVEYGIYLAAVGTEMRKRNLCFSDIADPISADIKDKVLHGMTAQGMSAARAPDVFHSGWAFMANLNAKTYHSRNEIVKAEFK